MGKGRRWFFRMALAVAEADEGWIETPELHKVDPYDFYYTSRCCVHDGGKCDPNDRPSRQRHPKFKWACPKIGGNTPNMLGFLANQTQQENSKTGTQLPV